MKNKLILTGIAMLVLLNVASFFYGQSNARQVSDLKTIVAKIPKEPIVYVGKDGITPKKGIDYRDGDNGADGINAISFNKTVVKDVPLIGETGKAGVNGKDARELQIRVNPNTKNIETKYDTDAFWNTLLMCSELQSGCPNQGTVPNQSPGEFESN